MHALIQRQLDERYALARAAWDGNERIRNVAATFGMTRRAYCDRYVRDNFPPLTWASGTSDHWQPDRDAAYEGNLTT